MFSKIFIDKPILAIVLSVVILIVGSVSLTRLPIEQFPTLAPPVIRVLGTYQGAGAEVVEQSVATPIEQKVNGVDNMLSLYSKNTSDGQMKLDVSFEVGQDLDFANMLTQNRVQQAQSRLPQEVIATGVTVSKINPSVLMVISVYSDDGQYNDIFLNNFAMINVRDQVLRVKGVSTVDLIGAEYSMRVWFKPDQLAKMEMTPGDVISVIKEQNIQAPAGKIGDAPSAPGQEFTFTVRAPGRLLTPEQFNDIILRETPDGRVVRLGDVARVELGSENYKSKGRWNGRPAAALVVYLLPGANQLEAAEGIYQTLDELQKGFPKGIKVVVGYDTTPAVEASIEEIIHTLVEAIILVILVVFVFLQNFRATIIPLLTVPISLIGTFIVFPLLGFSINTLSLFGLVLAIGIVVDDAIVVVEAVMHHIEHGKDPKAATIQAMKEVSGPVIAIALIFCAVFVPVGFLGGITGRMYLQFAITIAISTLFSALSALTLSPALSALILKAPNPNKKPLLAPFYSLFNKVFGSVTNGYLSITRIIVRRSILSIVAVGGFAVLTVLTVGKLPSGFVPAEDQGIIMINVALPNAASLERTDAVIRRIEGMLAKQEGIDQYNAVIGVSFLADAYTSNVGSFFVRLKPWKERGDLTDAVIIRQLNAKMSKIAEGVCFGFSIPTIPGFGNAGGVKFYLQDRSGTMSVADLQLQVTSFMQALAQRKEISKPFTQFDATVPQLEVELDREKARKLGVPVNDVFTTLQTVLGGAYVNDFNRFGRLYRVYIQSEALYRQRPEDIGGFYVRSSTTGDMVPLSTLVNVKRVRGSEITYRYNLYRSVEINTQLGEGYTSGQAMQAIDEVAAATLPQNMGIEYSGLSFEERRAPNPLPTFGMAVVFVFLLLTAQYNSWKLPWSVLLGTPIAAFGAFGGVWAMGLENNVFVQIGLILLVGLAAKNAILIVEFAKQRQHEAGIGVKEAALESAQLRFRPILMTAFAFILGVVPLMTASGSGAGARKSLGTAVFFGMLIATLAGVIVAPGLFAFIEGLGMRNKKQDGLATPSTSDESASSKGEHHA